MMFAKKVPKLLCTRQFLWVKLLSDEPDMPAREKDRSVVVKSITAGQKVVLGLLTVLVWLSA